MNFLESLLPLNTNQIDNDQKHGFHELQKENTVELNESIFYLNEGIRDFINLVILKNDREKPFVLYVEYFSKLVRQYLKNLKSKETKNF